MLFKLSLLKAAAGASSEASRVGGESSAVLGFPQVEQLPLAVGEAKRYPKGFPDLNELAR